MIALSSPTALDFWVVAKVGSCLGRHPALDMAAQGAIEHNILGGLWFGAALFVLWVVSVRTADYKTQRRLITTLLGCAVAIAISFIVAAVIQWPPPSQHLGHLFPGYLKGNVNPSSLPSQSTALYSACAAGVFSVRRRLGTFLWISVLVLVAIPRVYVGGHYPTDVVVGLVCGVIGFDISRRLESLVPNGFDAMLRRNSGGWIFNALLFLAILQVSTEFRDVGWIRQAYWLSGVLSADKLCIGGDTAFGQHFSGRIDEVRIYSRALSALEIQRDMNTSVADGKNTPSAGLVAAYAFDEGAGNDTRDASGNGNTGVIVGATWTPDGKYDRALAFNGTSSRVEVQDAATLHPNRGISLEAWVYPSANQGGWQDVIYKEVDVYYLGIGSPQSTAAAGGSQCGFGDLYAPSKLPANSWTHVAATCDGAFIKLYVNGVQVASRTRTETQQ